MIAITLDRRDEKPTHLAAVEPSKKQPPQAIRNKRKSSFLNSLNRNLAICGTTCTLPTLTVTAITLMLTSPPTLAVVGGERTSEYWVVQVFDIDDHKKIGTCTGAALSAELVITAKHCIASDVVYPDGANVPVHSRRDVPQSDIQLLTLSYAHPLAAYPPLGPNFLAEGTVLSAGTVGTAYGYGKGGEQKSLDVVLEAHAPWGPWVEGLRTAPANGEFEPGDSGGALMVDEKLVGILKGGGREPSDNHALGFFHGISSVYSTLRQLQHHREFRDVAINRSPPPWISAVNIEDGKLSVTMSSTLINSGKNVGFWKNGVYIGNVKDDVSYYCQKTNFDGGSVISPSTPLNDGDLIQIGIRMGDNSPESSKLLYEKRFEGIETVDVINKKINTRVSSTLMNSGKRVIFWLNGNYVGEIYNGSTYYAGVTHVNGGSIISIDASSAFATLEKNPTYTLPAGVDTSFDTVMPVVDPSRVTFQIGVVSGYPGSSYGTPEQSKLLYSRTFQ